MSNILFQKYSGKRESERLTIFKEDGEFIFVHETFNRTNPSKRARLLGIKPIRMLVSSNSHFFKKLDEVDFSQYPFYSLMTDFNINHLS